MGNCKWWGEAPARNLIIAGRCASTVTDLLLGLKDCRAVVYRMDCSPAFMWSWPNVPLKRVEHYSPAAPTSPMDNQCRYRQTQATSDKSARA